MSDLVGNPKDQFSHVSMNYSVLSCINTLQRKIFKQHKKGNKHHKTVFVSPVSEWQRNNDFKNFAQEDNSIVPFHLQCFFTTSI